MTRVGVFFGFAVSCLWLPTFSVAQEPALSIVSAGPEGELAQLDQASEIRIVFSEPMVTLGRIPSRVTAPFLRISPEVPGTFRWSGTTVLIFIPDPEQPLPYATPFEVTVDTSATAVSGRTLSRPFTFGFTTPTARLLQTRWYRRGGAVDGDLVVLLRFNQPVVPTEVASHLTATLEPHDWNPPSFTAAERERLRALDPAGLDAFAAKVEATRRVAAGGPGVGLRLTDDWDSEQFPAAPDLVALETTTPVRPESWVKLELDAALPSPAGPATPPEPQSYTIKVERAFFITDFRCTSACDADRANPLLMRAPVKVADFAAALQVTDITSGSDTAVGKAAEPRGRRSYEPDAAAALTLEDAGFAAQPPDTRYVVTAPATFQSADGQTLGYPWLGIVENWHMRAFTSFGDGHGVWETDGGSQLPFYARNLTDVRQWAAAVSPGELMPRLLALQKSNFADAPPGEGKSRQLAVTPDRVQSHGLEMSDALRETGTGLVWAAVEEGATLERARRLERKPRTRAAVVQVTNLGITVKDSPRNTLIFVTRLDTGAPVEGAEVSIVRLDNTTFWRGTTAADGVAVAPETPLRDPDRYWQLAFVVIAEKDGDIAYVGSDWNEGISPWNFGTGINLREREPLLRGSVFTDRGVYRPGEEVHFKAILRHNAPDGVRLLPAGTPVLLTTRDAQNRLVDERVVPLTDWSSAEWTMVVPEAGSLGRYSVRAILGADRPQPKNLENRRPGVTPTPVTDQYVPYEKAVHASFLVAAYRRPDFRVDVSLTGGQPVAGDSLEGQIAARYLYGAPVGARPVAWRFSKAPSYAAPASITEVFGSDRWVFAGWAPDDGRRVERGVIRREETALEDTGVLGLSLETRRDAGIPYVYSLEGDVEDVSRQHIANRASVTVHPAPFYVGLRRPDYFVEQERGLQTEIVAVNLDGTVAAGVPIDVTLTQVQWTSVRRAEGNGFYIWDTERKEIPTGTWTVTSAPEPVPLDIAFDNGGYYVLEARSHEDDGRFSATRTAFYVLGDGYTAWARFDHNRIELVPERQTYAPGDTARIMIQSPWEEATALVTTEREGIRSHRQFALTSTQQSIAVPIAEDDIPNVFVSVLLVKGRTNAAPSVSAAVRAEVDTSDPGKPAFRLGYAELEVEDRSKRLDVTVTADREEYRPADSARVTLAVKDAEGAGVASEVTLWAVDYGVLSLTSYQAPDVAGSVYVRKSLQVFNADNRQRIISRRVLTPKGESDGGGGGAGGGEFRRDFRALAFWLGSVTTGEDGRAGVEVTLPESLTTYRIMAVAGDRASRFGSDATEVRTNKPLTLRPAFPRFLAVGDSALFGAVVGSQLPEAGTVAVTMESLDPEVFELAGSTEHRLNVPGGGSTEVRFRGTAKSVGQARVRMTARIGGETDAFEDVIPVSVLASPETVSAYGETNGAESVASEAVTVPSEVVAGLGGLHVEVSSTAMVGLGEGARYLVEYPYGCAEQKASASLALVLAADLGEAFTLPGLQTDQIRPVAQRTLRELETFQCGNGGFAYWPGACWSTSPYLTAYILHVFKSAVDLTYDVDGGVRDRAYAYLERELAARPPDVNEGWWPSYTAWQAFAVKVLVESGRRQDSHVTRLFGYRDRMPVFALAYLHDAMLARGETRGSRVDDLRRRIANAILPEGGTAHVEELADPYLLWFWNSNVRSTAIVLGTLVRSDVPDAPLRALVRWMMAAREDGRWGNTQENAHALEALVAYYRKHESVVPDFRAVVALGARELMRQEFQGRSTQPATRTLTMPEVLAVGAAGNAVPLTFRRDGTGTLFYATRLEYAVDTLHHEGLDSGFRVERRYEPFVENETSLQTTTFDAGALVRVTLRFTIPKERRFVAVTDPLPAGFEAVESWFATTARDVASQQDRQATADGDAGEWTNWWRHGGFDRVERHDDRVRLFATRLAEGVHEFSYVARATTAGRFRTAPTHVEEMYEPEVFGRTATTMIEVEP